jgi:serine/threonine-protein kinase
VPRARSNTSWPPGARIGDYIVDRQLLGKTSDLAFAASHVVLPRRVRIQIVHHAFTGLDPVAGALMREAVVLETLRCAGIPRMFECGTLPDRRPWIAVELLESPALTHPLGVAEATALLRDVAAILAHAHSRGVIHRNLRPAAIVPGAVPMVTAWHDARMSGMQNTSALTLPAEGLEYRAPELVTGDDHDERVDVFALGVVIYQAISGALPMAIPLARRCPAVPARLAELVDLMIATDPFVRPNAAEVRTRAARIAEMIDVVPEVDVVDEVPVEVPVELIELVELADPHTPPPVPERVRLRWTPSAPYEKTPAPQVVGATKPSKRTI